LCEVDQKDILGSCRLMVVADAENVICQEMEFAALAADVEKRL
jgi:hypothetical protein